MPSDVITVTNLHRSYGRGATTFEAVRGLSLSVRRGELFALLGTNGAGKTSTLEVLEGLAPATSGIVRVLGHDPYRERPLVRPRIGIMLQEAGFAGYLSVEETARAWAGTLTAARPVAEVLEQVGLSARAMVAVRQLSGGERRRLDLALAVLGRPDVLFLDEPTTGLDPEGRLATWRLVRGLLAEGTTVLLTTHHLEEAAELADRLAILHEGVVARTGTPAEVTASQPAQIRFAMPVGATLPALPHVLDVVRAGSSVIVHTSALQPTVAALLAWASAHDLELADLNARSASLEEAFLAVAGGVSR
jgi:ABC-2 type transport system ATP-binding protein